MAVEKDQLSDQLSKLSITNQQWTNNDDTMNSADLIPCSITLGYSFRCQLPLKQLIDQQLSQSYFQRLLFFIEQKHKIYNFHMRLRNRDQNGFTVDFIYKDVNNHSGPVQCDVCISCDMNNKLSQLSLIKQNPTTRIWLDAQLRNKLIVTPRKHIERLSEMSEEEMTHFWHDTQVLLNEEGCDWRSMILNHGKYRNHYHLHMKINIDQQQWNQQIAKKYKEKIEQMQYLLEHDENNIIQKNFGDRKFNQWSGIKNVSAK